MPLPEHTHFTIENCNDAIVSLVSAITVHCAHDPEPDLAHVQALYAQIAAVAMDSVVKIAADGAATSWTVVPVLPARRIDILNAVQKGLDAAQYRAVAGRDVDILDNPQLPGSAAVAFGKEATSRIVVNVEGALQDAGFTVRADGERRLIVTRVVPAETTVAAP